LDGHYETPLFSLCGVAFSWNRLRLFNWASRPFDSRNQKADLVLIGVDGVSRGAMSFHCSVGLNNGKLGLIIIVIGFLGNILGIAKCFHSFGIEFFAWCDSIKNDSA
jgi:hypothetical protein